MLRHAESPAAMETGSEYERKGCIAAPTYGSLWRISLRLSIGEAMADKKERTVSYRRAEWIIKNPGSITLSSALQQAAAKRTTVEARTIVRDNGQLLKLATLTPDKHGGFYLHLTLETPGEAASIIPAVARTSDHVEVKTVAAPKKTEFMDGDAFVYIRDNHVCLCATGIHDSTIQFFLQTFFKDAKFRKDAHQFSLLKIASVDKIKLIESQGVKEIELGASVYEATRHYQRRKAQPQGLLGAISRHLKTVLGAANDVNHDALAVSLTIKADRRRLGLPLGEKRIQTLATGLIDNQEKDDKFVIITKGDQRISPDEIFVRSKVQIDSKAKSVDRDKAWHEVYEFYEMLSSSGALGQ